MDSKRIRTEEAIEKKQGGTEATQEEFIYTPSSSVKLDIIQWPDSRLKKVAIPVEKTDINSIYRNYVRLLEETMYASDGVGIAATQVGWGHRLFIMRGDSNPIVILNPELHDLEGEQKIKEGCLSVPMHAAEVTRYLEGTLIGKDLDWNDVEFSLYGVECAIAQHEIDHLNGTLYIDRLSRLKRDILKRKRKKQLRRWRKYS